MVELGVMYATGAGVPADPAQARTLLERAAEAGNPRAVANHQEPHGVSEFRPVAQQTHERVRQDLRAMPRSERPDETEHGEAIEAVAAADGIPVDVGPVALRIDPVRWLLNSVCL